MKLIGRHRFSIGLALVTVLAWALPASGANYPLELTNIKPAGSVGFDATHRIFRAYPGLEYNIRAAVIGGAYPYTFPLSNAPSGMTVDARGVVRWPSPDSTASATIVVRDSEGTQVSATWTIDVTTAGFRFVDAVRGNAAPSGAGTLDNPWRTLADVYNNAGASDIIYFRAGTYNQLSLPRQSVGGAWERVEWNSTKACIWLAYPGETPTINFGYQAGVEAGPLLRISGTAGRPPYIDGFEARNIGIIGFQTAAPATFRRLRMYDLRLGGDGTNASFIMTLTQPTPVVGMVIQDSEFYNVFNHSVTIKVYAQEKLLIEDTIHRDARFGPELKDNVRRYTVRGNRIYNIERTALGGNMHSTTRDGEIAFNNIQGSEKALHLNQDLMAGPTYTYRNTLVGPVVVNATSSNGPFFIHNNVIVNGDTGTVSGSHITYGQVDDPSRVIVSNNLAGYPGDNIVDSDGRLTAGYASYLGTHGHQTSAGGGTVAPRAPTNVTIIR